MCERIPYQILSVSQLSSNPLSNPLSNQSSNPSHNQLSNPSLAAEPNDPPKRRYT